jgi:hypothetical protein
MLVDQINHAFQSKIASDEGRTKVMEKTGEFIRDRLREVAFCTQIVPDVPVTKADCQVSDRHDTLVKVVYLEPQSRGMTMTFRGSPTARVIRASRMFVGFYTVASELFQKTEQELLAYDMPITKIIEENSVKDMQEIRDREWLIHVESAIQATQQEANGGTVVSLNTTTLTAGTVVEFSARKGELARNSSTNSAVAYPLQRPDLANLIKSVESNRFFCEQLLMSTSDSSDLLQWTVEDWGNDLQSETAVDGYTRNKIMGKNLIRTIKTDICRPGNVYAFPKANFIGHNYVLNNVKFYIDKVANNISWQAWMDVSGCIANIAAPRKLETYSGDATVNDANSILASVTPKDESALGAPNNRVDSGGKFPNIVSF